MVRDLLAETDLVLAFGAFSPHEVSAEVRVATGHPPVANNGRLPFTEQPGLGLDLKVDAITEYAAP